jgi:hypothetical protein
MDGATNLIRGTSLTRALYAPVVLIAPALAAWLLLSLWTQYFSLPDSPWPKPAPPLMMTLGALVGFIIPGSFAWRRVLRERELIPAARLRKRPVVAFVVVINCMVALALLWLFITVLADAGDKGYRGDLGPLGGVVLLGVATSAIALLVGELVLVSFDRRDSAD